RRDLLVVNDNISKSIAFTPQFAESSGPLRVESWSWNGSIHHTGSNSTDWVEPYTANPVPQEFPDGLPANYTLPPQSLVLFEAYPSGGTYVRLVENGVPSPAPWYASLRSNFYESTASNISLVLPTGTYAVGSIPILLPVGGRERVPFEQLAPQPLPPFQVSGLYANLTIPFGIQWRLNATPSPAAGGTVVPNVVWWNDNQSLTLTATPAVGYAFLGWSGWGPGSNNSTSRSVTIDPKGRMSEKARFVVGETIEMYEFGLPTGTPWSVTIHNFTTQSNATTLLVYEPMGHFGFTVHPVPGYRALPRNGGFVVNSSWRSVEVQFVRITPPPLQFPVVFQITGLPQYTSVSITVRGATQSTQVSGAQFQLTNGSYAYHVGYIPGFHLDVTGKTFAVRGGSLFVTLSFVPTVYTVRWEASNTQAGMNWTVVVEGQPISATSAWASSTFPNGSYVYTLELPAGYSATPRIGVLVVNGSVVVLPILFGLVEFPAWFQLMGPAPSSAWSIRLGNATQGASSNGSTFLAANGTYTFDVHAPPGYYAVPSHGTITIAGVTAPTEIRFHLSSEQPSAALVAALSAGALWTSLWIGVSVFVGFAIFRGLRRRDG
ncbi:MAG: hypothetical protein L3J86_00760, partial [Thermoplasmata archaeon]|nr:hypothetical protein [Thermoplasmata archaeon]